MTLGSYSSPEDDHSFVDHLIRTGSGENAITEFLCGLLRAPLIRRTFLRELLDLNVPDNVVAAAIVESEPGDASARGVPDIQILSGTELFVLVENKLGAGFTNNQPHEYFDALRSWLRENPTGVACLVIQAPARRLASLEVEARSILRHRFGAGSSPVALRFVSWERCAEVLEGIQVPSAVLAYLVRSFVTMLPRRIESTSRPLTSEDVLRLMSPENLEAVAALEDLLRDVRAALVGRKYALKSSSDEKSFDSQGFEVLGDAECRGDLWVGISHRFGARFRCSPLLVQLIGRDLANVEAVKLSGRTVIDGSELISFDWVNRPAIPLTLPSGRTAHEHAETVVLEIEEIRRLAATTSTPDRAPVRP